LKKPNKAKQSDNLRGGEIAVSLSLNYTAIAPPHKLRLFAALCIRRSMNRLTISSALKSLEGTKELFKGV
jgi:hypothetical protein